jgi:hypothetical protein
MSGKPPSRKIIKGKIVKSISLYNVFLFALSIIAIVFICLFFIYLGKYNKVLKQSGTSTTIVTNTCQVSNILTQYLISTNEVLDQQGSVQANITIPQSLNANLQVTTASASTIIAYINSTFPSPATCLPLKFHVSNYMSTAGVTLLGGVGVTVPALIIPGNSVRTYNVTVSGTNVIYTISSTLNVDPI